MIKVEMAEELYNSLQTSIKLIEEPRDIPIDSIDDFVGKAFFFRTVTYHIVGKVEKILKNSKILVLSDASWIADSGRFMNFIQTGNANEVEPIGEWFINLDTVVDFGQFKHSIKMDQK